MYKAVLVDDDYPMLLFLQQLVPWEQLNIRLAGCFENGLLAYEHAMDDMPDILVTDIGMPEMDGIQLIDALRQRSPELSVVILTCHDDFKYAQQAVKLNVADYVLKESLNPEELTRMLIEIKLRLDQKAEATRKWRQLEADAAAALDGQQLNRKRLLSLIENPLWDREAGKRQAEEIGIRLANCGYIPVLCCIDRFRQLKERFHSSSLLSFAVGNVFEELLAHRRDIICVQADERSWLLLFPYYASVKVNEYKALHDVLDEGRNALLTYLKISVTQVIGLPGRDIYSLQLALRDLLNKEGELFYLPEGSITREPASEWSSVSLFDSYLEALMEFQEAIIRGGEGQWEAVLSRWLNHIRHHKFKPEIVKEWVIQIMLDLRLKIKTMNWLESQYSDEALNRGLLQAATLDELGSALLEHIGEMAAWSGKLASRTVRSEIIEARRYIMQHLDQKITLAEVAEHLHLNPTYFCRLFKRETGENFIDFIIRSKIEKAKELLDRSHSSVEQISALLGFESKSYFIRTFKKITGMKPMEYKNR
ncbi:MAG: two component transcriptional regulator, AraC family [Paenibacillaceae bacterium]|jgi:two-component system response regulator YesN|nr:two component transcriptional regulator, AraC family [Paenibacillaceae bacterium]